MNHQHSKWLDFENDTVRCSRIGCLHVISPSNALAVEWPGAELIETKCMLEAYKDKKVYVVRVNGIYLCSITGYTRGVLHLLDFANMEHLEMFRGVVSECFGVNLVQIQKENDL